ncbi:LacI family DNA-binding transcriptional regulator [Bifidobacterium aquikefiri]|uniref:LacI family DNA-binding transcriptional regulator n=1 Tax=Bifidobacterium aquikefiri TaxID=1653207 RepID=UPI0039EB5799
MPDRTNERKKRVTIVDVAKAAGVALSSASAALNNRPGVSNETRKRIAAKAEELGYAPSLRGRSLSSKRTFSVGLVIQRDIDVLESDPFFGSFITGIEEVISHRDYALVLQISKNEEETLERYRKLSLDGRVDGVFLNELRINDERAELIKELDLPAVAINSADSLQLPNVRQDASVPFRQLTELLIEQGHTRIGHVSGPREFLHSFVREHAWEETLKQHCLPIGPIFTGDFTYEGGKKAAFALMRDKNRPTAVVCSNDLMAVGFIQGCKDLGMRVPQDVSVTGYDGIALSTYIRPTLVTAKTNPRHLAREAAEMLMQIVDGGQPQNRTIPPATIVYGNSVGKAPRAENNF